MGPERIELSAKERERLKILQQVQDGHLQQIEAAGRLRLTARISGVCNSACEPKAILGSYIGCAAAIESEDPRALPARAVRQLRQARYAGFGPTLAAKHLARSGIVTSRETLRHWMSAAGLWLRKRRVKRCTCGGPGDRLSANW